MVGELEVDLSSRAQLWINKAMIHSKATIAITANRKRSPF